MAAITAAVNRQRKGVARTRGYVMTASTTIPKGALVQVDLTTGFAKNAVAGAADPVVGVAAETRTSPAGTETTKVLVDYDCEFLFAASSITQGMVGDAMLVIDNNTVDETSAASATVGALTEFVSTTLGWVFVRGLSV